jgi:hypothetical protein
MERSHPLTAVKSEAGLKAIMTRRPHGTGACRLLAQGCPLWALQQVGGYLGYTGRAENVAATAAHDPLRCALGKLSKNRR